jgi:hypothetical protein
MRSREIYSSGNHLWRFIVVALAIGLVLLVNQRPLYMSDSVSYLKGGNYALSFMFGAEHGEPVRTVEQMQGGHDVVASTQPKEVGAARSPIYSVMAAMLRAPGYTLGLLACIQVLLSAYVLLLSMYAFGTYSRQHVLLLAFLISVATSLPWYAVYAVPDIFAGLGILALALLASAGSILSLLARLSLCSILALSIAVHASHILILLGVASAAALLTWFAREKTAGTTATFAKVTLIFGAVATGLVATMIGNSIGFGDASPIAKRFPFALARSVDDGPARWYLNDICRQKTYVICDVIPVLQEDITENDFLWGDNGVRAKATPEQMEKIRQEELEIVWNATRQYPAATALTAATNFMRQFFAFGISDTPVGGTIERQASTLVLKESENNARPLRDLLEWPQYTAVFVAFVWLAATSFRGKFNRTQMLAISVVIIGLVLNAFVCGVLSAVTDRYQGRVVWILPILAMIFYWQSKQDVTAISERPT